MKASSILLTALLTFSTFGAVSADNHRQMASSETIVDIAVGNEDFSTLVTAVVEAGLVDTLSSEGPFTVFAPLNSAFAKLPAGTVEMLLMEENRELLQSILTYHVISGDVRASALQDGLTVSTVQGEEVMFEMMDGNWFINDAQILSTDIVASNGVIHVIDSVIMPPSTMETTETIVDIAVGNEDFSTLVTAVVEAGLVDTLSSEGPFTVFAPLNSAFAKLPAGTVEMLLMEENRELLQSILTYHVISGDVRASALRKGLSVSTVQGSEVRFEMTGGNWYINGAQIVATDIVGSNGVIHVIDSVIMPPVSMEDMEMQKDMIEGMLTDREMRLVMNFDNALQNLLSAKSMNVQNMLTNRVLSTVDIALNTMSLNESQMRMLEYIKLHIALM